MTDNNTSPALEHVVVDRLAAAFPGLSVDLYPDNPGSYQLIHPVGALLVRYAGSVYGKPYDTDVIVQERALAVEITVIMRSLHGKEGIIETLEAVRLALAGYAPPGFSRFIPQKDTFLGEYGGEWQYALTVQTQTVAVQHAEPQNLPLLKHITVRDSAEQTDIRKHPDGSVTTEITPL